MANRQREEKKKKNLYILRNQVERGTQKALKIIFICPIWLCGKTIKVHYVS
jgi:hypothetical protein